MRPRAGCYTSAKLHLVNPEAVFNRTGLHRDNPSYSKMRRIIGIRDWRLALVAAAVWLAGCEAAIESPTEPAAEKEPVEPRWSWETESESDSGEVLLDMASRHITDALTGAGDLVKSVRGQETVEPVPVEELEKLLPGRIGRYKRSQYEIQSSGLPMAGVTATYGSEDEGLSIAITDMAQFRQFLGFGMSFLLEDVLDETSGSPFERGGTHEVRGEEYPYYEEFKEDYGIESCTVLIWVEERFLIAANGHGVPRETCVTARESIPYRHLQRFARRYAPSETGNSGVQ